MRHQKKILWHLALVTIVGVLLCCTISNAQTVPQIAEKALAATVSLEMRDRNGIPLGQGSGFFVRHNLIATNYHVIEGAAHGTAKLAGKDMTYTIEGITVADPTNDLALLKVKLPNILTILVGIQPLTLGDSDTVRVGETVYVVGNPMGLEGTISDGIISSLRNINTKERLQMTAPISPGSSGGPVLNRKGEVIGVSVATYREVYAQNLNFAIPSNDLKTLVARSGIVNPFQEESQSISAETYFIRGREKFGLGDYEAAIADFDAVIRLKPDNTLAYCGRGFAKEGLGQYFAAISDYDTAIRLKPDDAYAYVSRGNAKSNLGQYSAAISDYNTAIRLKPDYAYTYYSRGNAKSNLGQYSAAISDYNTAIRLKPDDAYAYVSRGNAKSNLGQHSAAISDYDTAIRLKPDDVDAYLNRGNAKGRLGQYFAAISDYDTAIRLKPDDALAYYNRGLTKGMLKRFWEEKQDLRTALKLAKQNGDESLKAKIEAFLQKIDR